MSSIDEAQLDPSPLREMQKQCVARSICDDGGHRLPGAQWGFQLAQIHRGAHEKAFPRVRTVGFQRVSECGLDYLMKRPDPAISRYSDEVAINYTYGGYPPPEGDVCEQWRAEGVAVEIAVENILGTAPLGSFAQIVVCAHAAPDAAWADADGGGGARAMLADAAACADEVDAMKDAIAGDRVPMGDLAAALLVQRLIPRRVEVLRNVAGGRIWDRFEWVNEGFDDDVKANAADAPLTSWSAPRRLVPY